MSLKINYSKFCNIIRKARKQSSLSQMSLSNRLFITQKTYSKLEADQGNVSMIHFLKIMHILKLHPMEVIDQIVIEKPSWTSKKTLEDLLRNEIVETKKRNEELKAENVLLRNQIDKLLQKPCCKEYN